MRNYLNPASMVLFPAAKVSFDFLLQAANNYFASLDRIKFKAAGYLSFLCLPLGVFSFHCYKLKMVVGLFVYQHLFGSRETNVSDQPTSDSPTFSRCHLAVVTSAGATLPPWEGLFRHTASPRRERKLLSCCRTTSSREEIRIEALRTMTSKVSLQTGARGFNLAGVFNSVNSNFQKASGLFKVSPV